MFKKLAVPLMFLSLGVFAATSTPGCGGDSKEGGSGGKGSGGAAGGSGTGANPGSGGAGTGGAGTGGAATGGAATGGAATGGAATGGAATGGAATGGAGTAGAAGGTAGAAGGRGGAAGAAGGTAGAAGGRGGAAGGAAGSAGGAGGGAVLPVCSVTTDAVASEMLTAADFCKNLLAACTGVTGYTIPAAYATEAMCETTYAASTKKHCQSYHLCGNSVGKSDALKGTHCPHASGAGPCAP